MSEAAGLILKAGIPILGSLYLENNILKSKLTALYDPSPLIPALPKVYVFFHYSYQNYFFLRFGAVILINLISTGLVLIVLGLKVANARKVAIAAAAKKGDDKDAEARYSYPKMYAEGFSEDAKAFNCVQRGHQQAFETYTQFVIMSIVGGIKFPVITTGAGLMWCFARLKVILSEFFYMHLISLYFEVG
jgi:uncharacterized MAPEG superfamily protein